MGTALGDILGQSKDRQGFGRAGEHHAPTPSCGVPPCHAEFNKRLADGEVVRRLTVALAHGQAHPATSILVVHERDTPRVGDTRAPLLCPRYLSMVPRLVGAELC